MNKINVTVYMTEATSGCESRAEFDALVAALPAAVAARFAGVATTTAVVEAARGPNNAADCDFPVICVTGTEPDEDGDGEYPMNWDAEAGIAQAVQTLITELEV